MILKNHNMFLDIDVRFGNLFLEGVWSLTWVLVYVLLIVFIFRISILKYTLGEILPNNFCLPTVVCNVSLVQTAILLYISYTCIF